MVPAEGVSMKTKPWPGRRSLKGVMEKMNEVENGKGVEEELEGFVRILKG